MTATLNVGKRLVPLEQVALLEPFDTASQSKIKSEKSFQTRIVLLSRDSLLSEEPMDVLVARCGFRLVQEDGIAFNPAVLFSVEAFEAAGDFQPTKPYRTRLIWRDQTNFPQSKLLLMEPEEALSTIVRGENVPTTEKPRKPKAAARRTRARQESPSPP